MTFRQATFSTPLGRMLSIGSETGLHSLVFDGHETTTDVRRMSPVESDAGTSAGDNQIFDALHRVLSGYFASGRLGSMEGLRLDPGGTVFQREVWAALRAIPEGQSRAYADLARALGLPAAYSRAIGAACGANPIAVLIPCHRIVASGGRLGGYRWGLDRKRALRALEGIDQPSLFA